jgi:competence ComEA-like helix-hairpin-helix protein
MSDVAQTQGIAPNCRILPVKISGKSVTPAYGLRAAAIRQALTYLKPGQRGVLNLSWRTNGEHIGIREALVEAQSKGVAIVASAGNYAPGASQGPDEIHYPSAHTYLYPNLTALCSVAATGFGDRKASYSYYGSQSITFSAPGGEKGGAGVGIYTTSTPEKRVYTRGTSFAAPHVVGLIALLFSAKPDLSAAEAIQIIKDTADPIDDVNPAYAGMLGEGRINARAALEWVAPLGNGTHDITATAGPHGTIAPAGEVTVNHGADQTFTITPDPGYRVTEVLVDGSSVGPVTTHSFENVTAPHTIEAQFAEEDGGEEPPIEPSGLLNINQATAEELITLPFIGPWLAERIIEYREAHGPFNNIWELSLTGMSPWAISQLEPLITV